MAVSQRRDRREVGLMALSDEEQRLLAQMEAALAAEDPKLVSALRGTGARRVHRRRAALAGAGFFLGLALLVIGITVGETKGVVVSVLGFVVMVAAAVVAITSWQHVGSGGPDQAQTRDRATTAQGSRAGGDQGFMGKMEERWRKRRDESGF
jgi:hypothetical protein